MTRLLSITIERPRRAQWDWCWSDCFVNGFGRPPHNGVEGGRDRDHPARCGKWVREEEENFATPRASTDCTMRTESTSKSA
eukprot:3805566-Rhodomonas_salina.2